MINIFGLFLGGGRKNTRKICLKKGQKPNEEVGMVGGASRSHGGGSIGGSPFVSCCCGSESAMETGVRFVEPKIIIF